MTITSKIGWGKKRSSKRKERKEGRKKKGERNIYIYIYKGRNLQKVTVDVGQSRAKLSNVGREHLVDIL